MVSRKKRNIIITIAVVFALIGIIIPIQVLGEVKPITEVEDRLEGITQEEQAVLEELFTINQKIDELEKEEEQINSEIETLQQQIKDLESKIEEKQQEYDFQLDILGQVLVDYQRGGPATYFEILLSADDFSTFLKSINVIKDISHNINDLLITVEESKNVLQEEKAKLDEKALQLDQKKVELTENILTNQQLQDEKEAYLVSLQEKEAFYTEQLGNLESMWKDCKSLFPKMAEELTNTINEGYFTLSDLNIKFGLVTSNGYIEESLFNDIIQANSKLTDTSFKFGEGMVTLDVPNEDLVLTGNFVIAEDKAIQFEVVGGSFYGMPLEKTSIEELFQNGPLLIDFNSISEGVITVDFKLKNVQSKEGKLAFEIIPIW